MILRKITDFVTLAIAGMLVTGFCAIFIAVVYRTLKWILGFQKTKKPPRQRGSFIGMNNYIKSFLSIPIITFTSYKCVFKQKSPLATGS